MNKYIYYDHWMKTQILDYFVSQIPLKTYVKDNNCDLFIVTV